MSKKNKVLSDKDKDVLSSLGHTIEYADDEPVKPKKKLGLSPEEIAEINATNNDDDYEQVETREPLPTRQQYSDEVKLDAEDKDLVSNPVLKKLRATFGLSKLETVSATIKGMKFTLRPLNAIAMGWAESAALQSVLKADGSYSIAEFQVQRAIYIAACSVSHIDDVPVTQVFDEKYEKVALLKLVDFLAVESFDELAGQIYKQYEEKIDSKVKLDPLE